MNNQAKTAFNQYKDMARAWQITNPDMAECASQLIQWINDELTGSRQETRQDVQSTNWQSLLSVFPTEAIQEEMRRREVKKTEYKEDLKIIDQVHTCGTHIIIRKWGDMYEASCNQCGVSGVWKDTEEQAIKALG
jgi:hypothetical protein